MKVKVARNLAFFILSASALLFAGILACEQDQDLSGDYGDFSHFAEGAAEEKRSESGSKARAAKTDMRRAQPNHV